MERSMPVAAKMPTQDCPPFLRWAGSKRRLLPVLKTVWTKNHKRYVEPFAGSACLFFALEPPKAILGDLNPELISTYIEVKYRISAVLKELAMLPPWNKSEYIRLRSLEEERQKAAGRARVARDSMDMSGVVVKESEQKALADQALADFAAKEGIALETETPAPSDSSAPQSPVKSMGPTAEKQ